MSTMKSADSLRPMPLIAGPCVIEDEGLLLEVAQELKRQTSQMGVDLYFKSSFDKANRSSIEGFRGPGLDQGLKMLDRVREKTGLKIFTDFHTPDQAKRVAEICDFIQVPAFLCRQTDMIAAAAEACIQFGRKLNVKKGQFISPHDAKNIVEKVSSVEARKPHSSSQKGEAWFYLCERGSTHGYNDLVVDFRGLLTMRSFGVPVIYDATHSIQSPGAGAGGKSTGGKREYLEVLARSAMAAGADGLFMECHPHPEKAKSDGPNAFYLDQVGAFVRQMLEIRALCASQPYLLPEAKNLARTIRN